MGDPVIDSGLTIINPTYTNSINGLIILTSVTLASIEFIYNGHVKSFIEDTKNQIRNIDYLDSYKSFNETVNNLKAERDLYLSKNKLMDFSPFKIILALIFLLFCCIILHILTLIFQNTMALKIALIIFFAMLPVLYFWIGYWLRQVANYQKETIIMIKRHENILEGYRSATAYKSAPK